MLLGLYIFVVVKSKHIMMIFFSIRYAEQRDGKLVKARKTSMKQLKRTKTVTRKVQNGFGIGREIHTDIYGKLYDVATRR